MVDYLYDEGDRDIIFFGHILGIVSYDRKDIAYDKSESTRFCHGIKLANFLVSGGDFSPGISVRQTDGSFRKSLYTGGFEEFRKKLERLFDESGIDNIDLVAGPWLIKNYIGRSAPAIPDSVAELFE
ncbi:hypothetical protein CO652_20875 [Rhizobium sp. H4]|nr:hypothetical protein CO652_20875 [Rhizobium sp. H4]